MSTPNWGDVRMQGKRTGNSKDPVEEVDSTPPPAFNLLAWFLASGNNFNYRTRICSFAHLKFHEYCKVAVPR